MQKDLFNIHFLYNPSGAVDKNADFAVFTGINNKIVNIKSL